MPRGRAPPSAASSPPVSSIETSASHRPSDSKKRRLCVLKMLRENPPCADTSSSRHSAAAPRFPHQKCVKPSRRSASIRARTGASTPQSARGISRISACPARRSASSVSAGVSSGRMTRSSAAAFSGICCASRNAPRSASFSGLCGRTSSAGIRNGTGGFSRRCAPSASSAARRRPFSTETGTAVCPSVSISTAVQRYGVPPVFCSCAFQRAVSTGSRCAASQICAASLTDTV